MGGEDKPTRIVELSKAPRMAAADAGPCGAALYNPDGVMDIYKYLSCPRTCRRRGVRATMTLRDTPPRRRRSRSDMENRSNHAPGRPGPAVIANRDDAISTEAGDILRP